MDPKLLNIGCGARLNLEWLNIDIAPANSSVRKVDIKKELPFPDNSFEVVYHSHVLEHLNHDDVANFTKEIYRVLIPSGIHRIVIPDLETLVKSYLNALNAARVGSPNSDLLYNWSIIMLLDQMVREQSGGKMFEFIKEKSSSEKDILIGSYKYDVNELISDMEKSAPINHDKQPVLKRLVRKALITFQGYTSKYLFGCAHDAIRSFRFRNSGEVHKWMYDSYSIKRLLDSCNFKSIKTFKANESDIPRWTSWNLDTQPDGSVYKSESIYMEARK